MFSMLKRLFKGTDKEIYQAPKKENDFERMVGEPVISFVKCLNQNPKRFKLKTHSKVEALSAGKWGDIYDWMDNQKLTGYYSLTDIKNGDVYYAIYHQQKIYTVKGFSFNLNWWELAVLTKEFQSFRSPARDRERRANIRACNRVREERQIAEQQERIKLAEKFS